MARAPKPSTEVAQTTPKETALVSAAPDFMKGMAGQGLEQMGSEDLETPRLLLLQPTSPQVEEYEDARAGQFWHNMLNKPIGKEFYGVLSYVDKRAILWRPRPPVDSGGILARSDDLKTWNPSNVSFDVKLKSGKIVTYHTGRSVPGSRLLEWGTQDPEDPNSQPAASLMYNAVINFHDMEGIPPAVFSFQRSSIKVGKKLLGNLKMSGVPLFGIVLKFSSKLVDDNGQRYYIPQVEQVGFVNSKDQFEQYKALYDAIKKSGLKMAEEDEDLGGTGSTVVEGDAEY